MVYLKFRSAKEKPRDYTKMPWDADFRVRLPTQVFQQRVSRGETIDGIKDYYFAERLMDYRKINLVASCYQNISGIVRNDNEVLLEVNIPFNKSADLGDRDLSLRLTNSNQVDRYISALIKEIIAVREIIKRKCYIVKSVCFKGDLLALSCADIKRFLDLCNFSLSEICVEIDNPKYITADKLDILKEFGNIKLIVNAITFNLISLRQMHRRYDLKEIEQKYKLLEIYGFSIIYNLVVGLLKEHWLQLERNIDVVLAFGAKNINLYAINMPNHSLPTIKDETEIADKRKCLELANKKLLDNKFSPYFINLIQTENGCFENVGYFRDNEKCKYVEDREYEVSTVLCCGAGGNSMVVKNFKDVKETLFKPKEIPTYIKNIDEIIKKNDEFFN